VESIPQLESEIRALKSDKASVQEEISSNSLQITSLRRHLNAIQTQLQQVKKEKEGLEVQLQKAGQFETELMEERKTKENLEKELESLKTLQEKLETSQRERPSLELDFSASQKAMQSLKDDLEKRDKFVEQLQSEIEAVKSRNTELENLKGDMTSMLELKELEIEELRRESDLEIQQIKKQVQSLKAEIAVLVEENVHPPKSEENIRSEEMIEELKDKLQAANYAIQESQSRCQGYEREVHQLKEVIDNMDRDMKHTSEVLNRFKDLAKGRAQQIKSLANELVSVQKESHEAQEALQKQIEEIRAECKSAISKELEVQVETRKRQATYYKEQLLQIDVVMAEVSGFIQSTNSTLAKMRTGKMAQVSAIEERLSVLSSVISST